MLGGVASQAQRLEPPGLALPPLARHTVLGRRTERAKQMLVRLGQQALKVPVETHALLAARLAAGPAGG